jgi:hypothetical protein
MLAMDIKKPRFDRPRGVGAAGADNPTTIEIAPGKWVLLMYQQKYALAQITEVRKPAPVFVGRIEMFDHNITEYGGLKAGDLVEFLREDIAWTGDHGFLGPPLG